MAWELLTTPEADGGYGFEPNGPLGHRLQGRRRGDRALEADRRAPRGAHPAPRQGHELLAHRPARTRRSLLRDLLRSRSRVRHRRRTGDRRRPVRRDLEPRVHAVPHRRREVEDRLPHRAGTAEEEHRHRHGPRARRVHQAGRREHVRDRPGAPGARPRRRDLRSPIRRRARRRRAHARDRRPRPLLAHADERRRDPVERGSRLHPPPTPAPHHPRDAAARRRGADLPRAVRRLARCDEGGVPRGRARLRPHRAARPRRGGDVPPHARGGHVDPRRRRRGDEGRRTGGARRRHGVPPARHLRLPDRAHARDGRGGGPRRRSRRVRPAHDRPAHAGEGRREVEEEGARRPVRLRRLPRQGRDDLHRLHRPHDRVDRARAPRRRPSGAGRRPRGRRRRSSSPRPRCTPSPAARRPTRAASSATGTSSRSSTCRSP